MVETITAIANDRKINLSQMPDKPLFIIPEGSPKITDWQNIFDEMTENDAADFLIISNLKDIRKIWDVHEMLAMLQHFPYLIPKFIFGVNFTFRQVKTIDAVVLRGAILNKPAYQQWFSYLGLFSFAVFFIRDPNARLFSLIGDWLSEDKVNWKEVNGKKQMDLTINQKKGMARRFLISSWMFYYFCYNTGFDPRQTIESLIKEFDLPVTFGEIKFLAEEDIKSGFKFSFPWIESIGDIVSRFKD